MNEILVPFSMSSYVHGAYKISANSIDLPKMAKPWIIALRPVQIFFSILAVSLIANNLTQEGAMNEILEPFSMPSYVLSAPKI